MTNITNLKEEHGDEPELIKELLKEERFIIPEGATFDDLYKTRHQPEIGQRIDVAKSAIEEANPKLDRVFMGTSFNSDQLGDEQQKNELLKSVLDAFGDASIDLSPSNVGSLDIIGGAYEFLISDFAANAGKKAGEFYTPSEVSTLIAKLVDAEPGNTICDPTCGSGSLLMKAGKVVKDKGSRNYELYGQEAIGGTWSLCKMNMFLNNEDNHRIEWGDTIRNPLLKDSEGKLHSFDIIVANPPFSLENWGSNFAKLIHLEDLTMDSTERYW